MSVSYLITKLKEAQIKIYLEHDQLKVSAPKEKLTPELIAELRDQKTGLIEFLGSVSQQKEFSPIPKVEKKPYYDASHAQKRLWATDKFEKRLIAYNFPNINVFRGGFDRQACEAAFMTLIKRHEILRTSFIEVDGELKQKINDFQDLDFAIEFIDLRDKSNKSDLTKDIIQQTVNTYFDFSVAPLLKIKLLWLAEDLHILVFVVHHIIFDGWSMGIVSNELAILYDAYCRNLSDPLPPVKIQYKDYTEWHHSLLSSDKGVRHKKFWIDMLHGELPVLALPTYQPRPIIQTFNGKTSGLMLSGEVTNELNKISRANESTLFMTMVSSLYVLFYKYTSQTDIITGTNNAGRTHQDIENSIGYFIDALPVRVKFQPENSFITLLGNLKKVMLGAYEHQIYPFDNLVDDLGIKRDLSRTPIFDVLVMMQNFGDRLMDKSLNVEEVNTDITGSASLSMPNSSSIVDLEISFREVYEGLQVSIRYNTDLFLDSQIDNFIKHFRKTTDLIVSNPNSSICSYDIISDEEKNKLLNEFSGITARRARSLDIIDLFRQQVSKYPDQVALVCNSVRLTYRFLDNISSQVAHCLREKYRIIEEDRIAILLDRSEITLITILGILKSGASYIAIDPAYPPERTSFILNDTLPALLIKDRAVYTQSDTHNIATIDIESFLTELAGYSTRYSLADLKRSHLAYIIYTSGSTGTPKGVMIERGSLTDYVETFIEHFELTDADGVIQQASLSFDTAMEEIFPVLCSGGKLIMLEEGSKNINALLATMQFEKPSLLSATPLLLNELKLELPKISSLKNIISGGDELKSSHIKPIAEYFQIHNTYGPSESTVCATYHRIHDINRAHYIGKPITNRQVYIVNEYFQLMSPMCVGEICISGEGIARGYLNQVEMTARSFVNNTFHPEAGVLYCTGDLGRWLPDGTIEFMGRKDAQVKIRGYRIELNEIESALSDHPEVKESVVLAKKDGNGDRFLVAYYVSDTLSNAILKNYLRQLLPEYMIPSEFNKLEKIPTNENGKVDKRLLQETDFHSSHDTEYVTPATEIEKKLIEIWEGVLERKSIGATDNFFEIGGHSLKAIKVASRINQAFQTKIEVRNIFENPTVHALALVVASSAGSRHDVPIPVAVPKEHYVLSHGQKGLYYKYLYRKEKRPFNMTRGIQVAFLNKDALAKTFSALVKKHEGLRTIYRMMGNVPEQKVIPADLYTPEIRYWNVQSRFDGNKFQRILNEVSFTSFNLETGPLFRVDVFTFGEKQHLLQITVDHIAVDAWSIDILANDILAIYPIFNKKEEPSVIPLPIQVKDFAEWQNNFFETKEFSRHKEYWKKTLHKPMPVLQLPVDFPRLTGEGLAYRICLDREVKENFIPLTQEQLSGLYGTIFSSKPLEGSSYRIIIKEDIGRALNNLALQLNTSLFNVILASMNVFVYEIAGANDITIGTPVTLRDHESLQHVIGWFLDTLLVRNTIDDDQTFEDLVVQSSKNTSEALSHRICPFEKILDDLDISFEDIGRVFIHLLNFESFKKEPIHDFKAQHRNFGTPTFDLNFTFYEFANGIELICDYRKELFKPKTIEDMIKCYFNILTRITIKPNLRIGELIRQNKLSDSLM